MNIMMWKRYTVLFCLLGILAFWVIPATAQDTSGEDETKKEGRTSKTGPKYLRVLVEPGPGHESGERVNIRVPIKLLRAGIKLASLVPNHAQGKINSALHEKGINFDLSQITEENLEEIVDSLNDLTVDVEGKESIRIFSE